MQQPSVVKIAESADVSTAFDLQGRVINLIVWPDTVTATSFGFQIHSAIRPRSDAPASGDSEWVDVAGTDAVNLSYTVADGKATSLDWSAVFGARWVRLKLGATEAAEREVTIFTVPIG